MDCWVLDLLPVKKTFLIFQFCDYKPRTLVQGNSLYRKVGAFKALVFRSLGLG